MIPRAYRIPLRILRTGLRFRLDAAETLNTARSQPIVVRMVFVAAARRRFGAAPRLEDIAAFVAAMYHETPMPKLGQRGLEAVLRGALGEPYVTAYLINTGEYLDAAIAITARILGERPDHRVFEDAVFRDAVDVYDELASQPPTDSWHDFRTVLTWADEPRWTIDGQQPRTVAGAWLKALSLRRKDEEDALRQRTDWRGGELRFLFGAFVYAMRMYFNPLVDLRDTSDLAAEIIWRFELKNLAMIDVEALIRSAVDDEFASTDGIANRDRFIVYGLGAGLVIWKIEAPPEAVDTFVALAETVAIELGWQPVFL